MEPSAQSGTCTPSSSLRLVTVAICTLNRGDVLRKTLERMRLLEIPAGTDWELLVVDNNSTDNTPAVLGEMTRSLPLRSLRETNVGLSYARNLVLKEARGEFIFWTDDDVLADSKWLKNLLSTFDSTGADFVFGRAAAAWPDDKVPDWYSPRVSGLFALLDYGDESFVSDDLNKPFNGLNFAARAGAHRQLGMFRIDYGPRGNRGGGGLAEDFDMYERALGAHMKIVYQPNAVVCHMIPPQRATRRFNCKKALLNQRRFYDNLIQDPPAVPWLFGLPRYYYRKMIDDLLALSKHFVTRNKPARFYYELQVLRFVGLFAQSWRYRLRGSRKDTGFP